MASQHRIEPGVVYPSLAGLASPHTSGDGGANFGYTGTDAFAVNCTALAGRTVTIFSEVTSSAANGSTYRYLWHTSATPPTLATSTAAGTLGSTNRFYNRFSGANPATEVVHGDRPFLICVPGASVDTAENVIVSVAEPVAL